MRMNLIEKQLVPCVRLIPAAPPDGAGGYRVKWSEGERFHAAVTADSSVDRRAAGAADAVGTVTITVPAVPARSDRFDRSDRFARSTRVDDSSGTALRYHDVIRRLTDGAVFRVTSDAIRPPDCASFRFTQVRAEEWQLPDGEPADGGDEA